MDRSEVLSPLQGQGKERRISMPVPRTCRTKKEDNHQTCLQGETRSETVLREKEKKKPYPAPAKKNVRKESTAIKLEMK